MPRKQTRGNRCKTKGQILRQEQTTRMDQQKATRVNKADTEEIVCEVLI